VFPQSADSPTSVAKTIPEIPKTARNPIITLVSFILWSHCRRRFADLQSVRPKIGIPSGT